MRAARLLQILLILQNRGRQTSKQLAEELEVATRTILRDVDAMTEAGLPIIVHQGNRGGIELGFNYRTRLTGLTKDEAEALGLILVSVNPMLSMFGLEAAAHSARAKLVESFPDKTRGHVQKIMSQFLLDKEKQAIDPRVEALSKAIRDTTKVRINFATPQEQVVHPSSMKLNGSTWSLFDTLTETWIERDAWGRVNISRIKFV